MSVNLLHFPDDLLFKDGQDGVVVAHLLEHDSAVKLVAHFLKVEPGDYKRNSPVNPEPENKIKSAMTTSALLTCNGPFW